MPTVTIQQAFELAVQHHAAGNIEYAQTVWRQILALQPNHPGALRLMAQMAYQTGRPQEAADWLGKAIAGAPNSPDLYCNLGNVLNTMGRSAEAIAAYRQAVGFDPAFAEAWNNLGAVLAAQGHAREAVEPLRQAAALQAQSVGTWFNLGTALNEAGNYQETAAAFRRAIALQPDHVEALTSLGNVLWELGQLPRAMEHLHEALRLRPDFPQALVNLANCLGDEHRTQEAATLYEKAMRSPDHEPAARYNLGLLLLRDGKLAEGFDLYEARRKLPKLRCDRDFPEPMWDGGGCKTVSATSSIPSPGTPGEGREGVQNGDLHLPAPSPALPRSTGGGRKTILLHAEQGLGDTIQFIRYVPLIIARGERVIVQCQPPLRRLLEGQCGIEQLVIEGDPLPAFDVHCPMLSLPRVFGTTLQTIPSDVPYLSADPARVEHWRGMLASEVAGLKVGLVWAGSPVNKNDWRRSFPLSLLAPLGQIPGVHFHSLQKGDAARQAQMPPPGMQITDWSEPLNDFAETAALIANLDLVISVDTAVVHLAGAMGKPVWLLLPTRADWRWMREREDSPWYPTMKLFRQTETGDWAEVVERVKNELFALSTARGGPI